MNNILLLLMGFTMIHSICEEEGISKDTPKCIEKKINEIIDGAVWNPPAKVYSYQYNGQKVYYFPSRFGDIPSKLYDEDCNIICSPDGGITGKGDGKCPDFFNKRTNEKLIWEDNRE